MEKPDYSRDLTFFMILFISSLEIINVVIRGTNFKGRKAKISVGPDWKFFWQIAATIADAGGVNHNGIKTLLANGFITFFIKNNLVFSNGPKILPKIPPDCPILCNWFFNNFTLADEPFAKAL